MNPELAYAFRVLIEEGSTRQEASSEATAGQEGATATADPVAATGGTGRERAAAGVEESKASDSGDAGAAVGRDAMQVHRCRTKQSRACLACACVFVCSFLSTGGRAAAVERGGVGGSCMYCCMIKTVDGTTVHLFLLHSVGMLFSFLFGLSVLGFGDERMRPSQKCVFDCHEGSLKKASMMLCLVFFLCAPVLL